MKPTPDKEQADRVNAELGQDCQDILHDIRAIILLAGQVRPSKLHTSLRRSVLDLPADAQQTLMDIWRRQAETLAAAIGADKLPLRILINTKSPEPTVKASAQCRRTDVRVEYDVQEYRGTGGVLRDLVEVYDDDHRIVVANGAQLVVGSLTEEVLAMARRGGDISLTVTGNATPTGVMLIRCGALRSISPVGFVDLKEQALPAIARRHKVTVVTRQRPIAYSVRTRGDYLEALLHQHRRQAGLLDDYSPFAENTGATVSIVEPGSNVAPTARIYDSVVLAGARVESEATLVHSIICAGGVVGRRQTVSNSVIANGANGGGTERK